MSGVHDFISKALAIFRSSGSLKPDDNSKSAKVILFYNQKISLFDNNF